MSAESSSRPMGPMEVHYLSLDVEGGAPGTKILSVAPADDPGPEWHELSAADQDAFATWVRRGHTIVAERLARWRPIAELKTAAGLDDRPEHFTEDIEYLTVHYAMAAHAHYSNPEDDAPGIRATALGDLIEMLHVRALTGVERLTRERDEEQR